MQSRLGGRPLIYALFFLSGISGLIYQIVWTRNLVLVFGNTMLATATVLSAFMGGLAAGSYALGIYIDRRPRPLVKVYAVLEAGIGLFAIVFPLLLTAATPLYSAIYPAVKGNIVALNLVRFVVCFALISIPTFMMGGTLPVLIKRFVEGVGGLGRHTGFLYGLNTTGAVVGTLACGYYMLKNLGMRGATWVAVAINLGVAIVAWFLARAEEKRAATAGSALETASTTARVASVDAAPGFVDEANASQGTIQAAPVGATDTPDYGSGVVRMVLIAIGISGFCALAYEVFWTRMLNLFLHNNIYSFTAILATFLIGIAAGSFLYARFLSRIRDQVPLFAALQLAIGLVSYATPYIFQLFHGQLFNDFAESLTLVKTGAIMVGPTILMGIAVPMAIHICQRGSSREGTSVGTVYAVNTVGAILGAFLAGFVLLPSIGLHNGVIFVAGMNILAGFLPLVARSLPARRIVWGVGYAAIMAVLVFTAPDNLFKGLFERSHPSAEILHYKEGKVANVVVYDFFKNGYKDMHLNAVEEASSRIWHVQLFKLLGMLPPMIHDDPGNTLMIAFGAGMSAGAAINNVPEFAVVDLNPDIDGIANAFTRENLDVINNPKLVRLVNDGRNELLLTDKKYSLIISDATNPKMFDSWTLYSQEFYELVKSRLKDDGIFCQWLLIPLPQDSIKVLLNTFRSVFPHMSFWAIYGSSQCLFMGTPERLEIDYLELQGRLQAIMDSQGLREFGVDSAEKFLSYHLLGEDGINALLEGFDRISTDDQPHPQFHVTQDEVGMEACRDLVRYQESILPYLTNLGPEAAEVERRIRAYDDISRRLNLGFLGGSGAYFEEAAYVAENAGMIDENVKNKLHYDKERQSYFENRSRTHPDDANAHNNLGHIYRLEGDHAASMASLERTLELRPTMSSAHNNLARLYMDMGDYDAATRRLLELSELNPTRTVTRMVATQLGIIHLLRKLEYEPDSAEHWRGLGIALYNDGQIRKAIRCYERAAELSPDDPSVTYNLARILERHAFLEEAAMAYDRLAALAPAEPSVRAKQAEFTVLLRDPQRRRVWLNEKIMPLDHPASTELAQVHPATCDEALALWHEFDFEGSIEQETLLAAAALYEESIEAKPSDLHAYVDAANIYESTGAYSTAAGIWQQLAAVSSDWNNHAAHNVRRLSLLAELEAGHVEAARRAEVLNEIATGFLLLEKLDRGIEYLEQSLAADPAQPRIWEMLAESLISVGSYAQGVKAANEALALDPDRARSRQIEEAYGSTVEAATD